VHPSSAAARAQSAPLTREGERALCSAVGTPKPDKAVLRVSTGEEPIDSLLHEGGDRAARRLHRLDVGRPPRAHQGLENTLGRVAGNIGTGRLHPRALRRRPGQTGGAGTSPCRIRIPSTASGFRMRRTHFGLRLLGTGVPISRIGSARCATPGRGPAVPPLPGSTLGRLWVDASLCARIGPS